MNLNKLCMKLGSTLILKGAIFVIGIGVLALASLALPEIIKEGSAEHPLMAIVVIMYLSMIPFYIALHRGLKLLHYIDTNKAFSDLSVHALRNIKYCALTISVLYTAIMPSVFRIAQADDAPGLVIFGALPIFASFIVAVLCALLQKILYNAIAIKSENDLTV
jgi:hypothetical protein